MVVVSAVCCVACCVVCLKPVSQSRCTPGTGRGQTSFKTIRKQGKREATLFIITTTGRGKHGRQWPS